MGPCVRRDDNLMPEMPYPGKHHGDAVLVGGLDHFFVAERSAGLDYGGGTRPDAGQPAVGEREESGGWDHRALGQRPPSRHLGGRLHRPAGGGAGMTWVKMPMMARAVWASSVRLSAMIPP